jgi:TRAP-type C4-dicarboxylate transport system permease small subunit
MSRLSTTFGRMLDALAAFAAIVVLVMVAIVTADVILRNLTRAGLPWANEVSEYALYLVTMLSAPWLLRHGRHVRVDLVSTAVPHSVARWMEIVADLLGLAVCLIFASYGAIMTWQSFQLGSITIKNLVFPEWWLLTPLPFAFLLLATEFVFRLHRTATGDGPPGLPAERSH